MIIPIYILWSMRFCSENAYFIFGHLQNELSKIHYFEGITAMTLQREKWQFCIVRYFSMESVIGCTFAFAWMHEYYYIIDRHSISTVHRIHSKNRKLNYCWINFIALIQWQSILSIYTSFQVMNKLDSVSILQFDQFDN